jgi:hypothetical protein
MGLNFLGSSGDYTPPNPNPFHCQVVKRESHGDYQVLEVKYFGCTTFSGHKLLLTRDRYLEIEPLDPHLLGDGHPVMARFEPTEEGWALARLCLYFMSMWKD